MCYDCVECCGLIVLNFKTLVGSHLTLILQSLKIFTGQPSQRRKWDRVGGWALIWRKLPIIQLSTSFPLVHRSWIDCQKATESEKVNAAKTGQWKEVRKGFSVYCSAACTEQNANKAWEKEALDLGKHGGASRAPLCLLSCLAGAELSRPGPAFTRDPLTGSQTAFHRVQVCARACLNMHEKR